jgi:hypothetical protein
LNRIIKLNKIRHSHATVAANGTTMVMVFVEWSMR